MLSPLTFLIASFISLVSAATLQGSASITPQDYYGLPSAALANNPPACGMPYNELNLARITAVANMNTGSTCNLCLKVVNSADTSKFIYVLAVDLGGSGLDLSIPSFEYLFGQRYDASPASWTTVSNSYCEGIYTPGKVNNNQGVDAGSSSLTTTTTTKSKTTTTTTTTTKSKTTTTTKSKATTTTTKSKATTTTTKSKATTTTTKKSTTKNHSTKITTKKSRTSTKTKTTTLPWWKTHTRKSASKTSKKTTKKSSKKSSKKSTKKSSKYSRREHGDQKKRHHH